MPKYRVIEPVVCSRDQTQLEVGDLVDFPEGTEAHYLELVEAPARKAKAKAEKAAVGAAVETATTD
jgi:hypothetical protein